MSLIVWVVISAMVYVASFKDDFTEENINKAMPFIVAIGAVTVLLTLLYSL